MGKLIVIDGLDGSGKATQAEILYSKLKNMGKNAYKVDFPDYTSDSSAAVKMYLTGQLGKEASKINPYMCGLFYTVDRAIQFTKRINDIYNQNDSIIICDRYISANVIHQGSKLLSTNDKNKYFEWIYDLEVNKVGLPRDDITIILSLPVEISQRLMSKRYNNHEEKKDIHEADIKYLEMCFDTVDKAVKHLNEIGYNWIKIDCSNKDNNIRTKEEIENDIWLVVKDMV